MRTCTPSSRHYEMCSAQTFELVKSFVENEGEKKKKKEDPKKASSIAARKVDASQAH